MADKRDWLILSLRKSKDWLLVWYCTGNCGYTTCLLTAGRYTEEEARRDEHTGHVVAVPLSAVLNAGLGFRLSLPNHERVIKKLTRAGRPAEIRKE